MKYLGSPCLALSHVTYSDPHACEPGGSYAVMLLHPLLLEGRHSIPQGRSQSMHVGRTPPAMGTLGILSSALVYIQNEQEVRDLAMES